MTASSVQVLPFGSFGKAVMRYLTTFRTDVVLASSVDEISFEPDAIVVFPAWRPSPAICESIDFKIRERQGIFIPVVVDRAKLCVGPVISSANGPCWDCWTRRSRQHEGEPEARFALNKFYEDKQLSGPCGYLEPFAMIAAGRVQGFIEAERDTLGGQLWEMDFFTRQIVTARICGVHACPRCGLRLAPESRTVVELKQSLTYLWSPL